MSLISLHSTYKLHRIIFIFLCLTHFTWHNTLKVHPCCKWQNFFIFLWLYIYINTLFLSEISFFLLTHTHTYICIYVCCYCCSVTQSCPTLWDPMDCSTPGFTVLHLLLGLAQTHVHWVSGVIYIYHIIFIHAFISGHLGWFFSSFACCKQCCRYSDGDSDFISFKYIPQSETAGL